MPKSRHRKSHKTKVQQHRQELQSKRAYVQKLTEDLETAIRFANQTKEGVETRLPTIQITPTK